MSDSSLQWTPDTTSALLAKLGQVHAEIRQSNARYTALAEASPLIAKMLRGETTLPAELRRLEDLVKGRHLTEAQETFASVQTLYSTENLPYFSSLDEFRSAFQDSRVLNAQASLLNYSAQGAMGVGFVAMVPTAVFFMIGFLEAMFGRGELTHLLYYSLGVGAAGGSSIGLGAVLDHFSRRTETQKGRTPYATMASHQSLVQDRLLKNAVFFDHAGVERQEKDIKSLFVRPGALSTEERLYYSFYILTQDPLHPLTDWMHQTFGNINQVAQRLSHAQTLLALPEAAPVSPYLERPGDFPGWYGKLPASQQQAVAEKLLRYQDTLTLLGQAIAQTTPQMMTSLEREALASRSHDGGNSHAR